MEESLNNNNHLFLTIHNSVTKIHNNEFQMANLSEGVVIDPINSSLQTIGNYAFANSYITKFIIPTNVTTLGDYCFHLCTNLLNISLQDSKCTTIPISFCDSCYTLTNVKLSDSITTINDYAFCGCSSLENINIPYSVTTINNYVFYNCSELKEFTLSKNSNINKFGDGVFQYCSSLQKFTFPKKIQSVGNNIFESCHNLKDVYFLGNNIYPQNLFDNSYSNTINIYYKSKYNYHNHFNTNGTTFNYIKLNSNSIPISNVCFLENTKINTDQGIIEIKNINPKINTIYNKKIIGISKTITNEKYLISFEKSCLYNNVPKERTILSQNHKIFYKGKWLQAYLFLNIKGVNKIVYNGEILYNILMEKYDKVIVNNLICETLHPNNIIAKIIKNDYTEEYKNKIIILMNKYIMNKEYSQIKKLSEIIS
jgi:hypothetical protein